MIRSEYAANLSLAKTEQPTWTHSSRCNRQAVSQDAKEGQNARRCYGVLQISQRHPSLFQRLFGWMIRK